MYTSCQVQSNYIGVLCGQRFSSISLPVYATTLFLSYHYACHSVSYRWVVVFSAYKYEYINVVLEEIVYDTIDLCI